MKVSRRSFIKGAAAASGLCFSRLGFNIPEVYASVKDFRLINTTEYTTICTFCACGCGMIGYVKGGKLINLEGDSDHVVSEGGLCSKGAAMCVIPDSSQRVTTPMYRAPGANKWETISWDDALNKIAAKVKKVRDESWISTEVVNGRQTPVNRTEEIAFTGSAQVHNEECYLYTKMARAFGIVYLEHQARLCHSSTVPALSASFGRGAMTNSWNDLKNAKAILIEGCNPTENHPMCTKWMMRAQENGAVIIHVDPRFTRTSKVSDIHAQIRPGTDIAFLGSIIKYVVEDKLYDENFLRQSTNAFYLVNKDFDFHDGLFSGFSADTFKYDTSTWAYQLDAKGKPIVSDTLDHPDCVLQKVLHFYNRYSFDTASSITGIPADKIKLIADTFISHKPGTIMYALGMTQHTVGVQNIRSFGVLQLLLGNVGKPGTGINALRGEPNVQGSTDFALLYNYLPGYMAYPDNVHPTIASFENTIGSSKTKYLINLMKAWFGENANKENDYCFGLLPKKDPSISYSIYRIFETAITDKKIKLFFVAGQNPRVTSPNLNIVQKGLENIETLVVIDPFMTETASFWEAPGVDSSSIKTEVIFLPAASFLEKDGTLANSSRMIQWRHTALVPTGESKSDLEIADLIYNRVKSLYKDSKDPKDSIFQKLKWDYPKKGMSEAVLKEINGYNLKTGKLLNATKELRDDGTTSSGNWIYCGCITEEANLTQRRDNHTDPSGLGIFPNYSWTWPNNTRILYNRASCDSDGKPLDESHKLIWWDKAAGKWSGYDVPDISPITDGPNTPNGQRPFRMSAEGVGRLFAAPYKTMDNKKVPVDISYVPVDGPLPEFYEPIESPTKNILHPSVSNNPCVKYPRLPDLQPIGTSDKFPYVLCTSSISEMWCGGAYTRNVPWLNELVKETFIELPESLADKLKINNGEWVKIQSARGAIRAKAMVTKRIHTLNINGKEITIVWMPYNWSFKGLSKADNTNLLTIDAGDPNTWIQETKACLVNVEKA